MIKVENLTFTYTENEALIDNLSFEIKKGSWISIIGHNGSGKSTLAKLLVGLLKPTSGRILIDGILLDEETVYDIRKKIGIVFQNPDNQFVGVTVRHDIAFGMENKQIPQKEMQERVEYFAGLVGMKDFLNKEPHHLSGGQKQRVAIAGALAMNQDVLIFDEATSMLDPEGVNEVSALITNLNKEMDKTIITITHDLDFALRSDYVIVLKEGSIIMQGTPEEVLVREDILKQSSLTIPPALKLYNDILNDKTLNKNKKLKEALWAFNLTK